MIDTQSVTKTITITQPAIVSLNLVKQTLPTSGKANGSFTVSGSGGTKPYQFSINGTAYQSSGTFSNLIAGTYTAYLKDTNNCSTTLTVINGSSTVLEVVGDKDQLHQDLKIKSKTRWHIALMQKLHLILQSQFNLEIKSNIKQTVEILVVDILGHTVYHTRGESTNSYKFGAGFCKGFLCDSDCSQVWNKNNQSDQAIRIQNKNEWDCFYRISLILFY